MLNNNTPPYLPLDTQDHGLTNRASLRELQILPVASTLAEKQSQEE